MNPVITTLDGLAETVEYFSKFDSFQFDIETLPRPGAPSEHRGDPRRNRIHWMSMATHGRAVTIPFSHPNGEFSHLDFPLTPTGEKRKAEGLSLRKSDYSKSEAKATKVFLPPPEHLRLDRDVKELLRPLLFSDRLKVNHNLKFDIGSWAKYYDGQIIPPPYADTMIAEFILDVRNKGRLALDDCVERRLGYKMVKGVGKKIEDHTFADVGHYGFLDGRYAWLLWLEDEQLIAQAGMENLFRLEMDVLEVVIHMEMTGAPINVERLRVLEKELREEVERLEIDVYKHAGAAFNITSNQELQRVLFTPKKEGGLGLKSRRLTPGGQKKRDAGQEITIKDYSVDEPALDALAAKHPIVPAVQEYKSANKIIGSFITPYIGGEVTHTTNGKTKTEVRESLLIDGRIHASFNQTGTMEGGGAETGRFSSSNPNLQQVPVRSEMGKKIRSAFSVEHMPGWLLVQSDYSQIEPRILADQSEDPRLLEVYLSGGDIYTTLADPFGLSRDAGKVLVLSVAYGTGPDKLASVTGMTLTEAKDIIYEQFPRQFPSIYKLKKKIITQAKRRKPAYVETLLGRRRYLPELFSLDDSRRRRAERQAFNTFIQGSAADINKIGLVRTFHMIPEGAIPILTVHDEVVVLTPEDKAEETAAAVREAMEGVSLLNKVPLVAEAKIVTNWGEAK